MAVAAEIVRQVRVYAQIRRINVLAELNVPRHADLGVGYPELWPSKNCSQPLDVSSDFTFKLIDRWISFR
ncbi:hypothetical protein CTI12_AA432120 [Artemisia annua]|uniref:Beta-N-acetylhexosaminidase n=1 Tax=Artemisia annua TaxID=35608 RepID=A0A2U1M070_ARTAN|nr:hypothetical protein CTI12_AA432120 [Artemisia annua]